MKTLAIKENDFDFSAVATGKEEIMHCIELDFGSALNEFILDLMIGRNEEVFRNKPTTEAIVNEVRRVILNEPRVNLVGDITITTEKASRHAKVRFVVEEVETGEPIQMEVSLNGAN